MEISILGVIFVSDVASFKNPVKWYMKSDILIELYSLRLLSSSPSELLHYSYYADEI